MVASRSVRPLVGCHQQVYISNDVFRLHFYYQLIHRSSFLRYVVSIIALWPIISPMFFSCFLYLGMSKITVYLIHEVYSTRIHMPFFGNARTRNCPFFFWGILLTRLPTGAGCNTRSFLMWGVYLPIQKLARLPCQCYSTDLPSFSTMTTVLSQSWYQSPSSVINEETFDPSSVVRNQRFKIDA